MKRALPLRGSVVDVGDPQNGRGPPAAPPEQAQESGVAVDLNDGTAAAEAGSTVLEHASVRELIALLARVEEESLRCAESGVPGQRTALAERGQAIVTELRRRSTAAALSARCAVEQGKGAGTSGALSAHSGALVRRGSLSVAASVPSRRDAR